MLVLYGEILQSCQRIDHDLLIHLYVDRDHVARPLNKIEIQWFSVHNIFLKKGKIAKLFGKIYAPELTTCKHARQCTSILTFGLLEVVKFIIRKKKKITIKCFEYGPIFRHLKFYYEV